LDTPLAAGSANRTKESTQRSETPVLVPAQHAQTAGAPKKPGLSLSHRGKIRPGHFFKQAKTPDDLAKQRLYLHSQRKKGLMPA